MDTYLICPICGGDLDKKSISSDCRKCNHKFDVIDGIPILVDVNDLPDNMKEQVAFFEKESECNKNYELKEWQRSYLDRFAKEFGDVKDKLVVDCGAGSGYMALELAARGANIIALDLTLKSLARLKKNAEKRGLQKKIDIVCCSADKLPLRSGVADYFISNAVLEHLPKEKTAIDEINRVCKDDAGAMITVPLAYKNINPLLLPINYIHDRRIGHLRRYDKDIIAEKFKGWRLASIYHTGYFKKVLKSLINMAAHVFDEKEIEREDRSKEGRAFGASNIICFLKR